MTNGQNTVRKKKIDFRKMHAVEEKLKGLALNTVCHNARCPNISECYDRETAAFMILGNICTRGCSFCNVESGMPVYNNDSEPALVAQAARRMLLKYIVVTSVTRDDLDDGGASVFAETIRQLREYDREAGVEVLVPDFGGSKSALNTVLDEKPDMFAHNMETVPSLYAVRKGAEYDRSLKVLAHASEKKDVKIKSGIMLGLGEKYEEVISTLKDIADTGCRYMSIGQYMRPGSRNCEVKEYITGEMFEKYRADALEIGFRHVESGPWVRSSYMAEKYTVK
ncbi:MAG: lipoyl synthase [Candidatus Goldiibacteriota bacterium]